MRLRKSNERFIHRGADDIRIVVSKALRRISFRPPAQPILPGEVDFPVAERGHAESHLQRIDVKGFYDIQIGVTPEDFNLMMAKAAVTRGVPYSVEELAEINAATPQSFIDGLDKAGLKVEKGKAPLEVINIDELKKTPTEN